MILCLHSSLGRADLPCYTLQFQNLQRFCRASALYRRLTSVALLARQVSAAQVHELFKNISDEDCRAIGLDPEFARPDWLVITRLPVPPLAVRPAVEMGTGGNKSQ